MSQSLVAVSIYVVIICCRCPANKLIMIGDRYLTDIVYGNRHGMLTIRPSPLTREGEPQAVRWVRECSSPCVQDQTLWMPPQYITDIPSSLATLCWLIMVMTWSD